MSPVTPQSGQESRPDRWWVVSIIVAGITMAAAIGLLYLPGKWSWVLVLGLIAFALTYRLHPARWYRRRAEAAMFIAGISTAAPGLKAVFQWGPDTVAGLIIETGWPAIVLPWLAAMWFGWLDIVSRRPTATRRGAGPLAPRTHIQQALTGIAGGVKAKTLHLHIHQEAKADGEVAPAEERDALQDRDAPPRSADTNETGPRDPKPSVKGGIAESKLLRHGVKKLVGRGKDLGRLTRAWEDSKTHVVSIVAWGGVGKTSLVVEWMARFARRNWDGVDGYFDWSFYSQGTRDQSAASGDAFVAKALEHFGDPELGQSGASPREKGLRLAELVAQRKSLLILDGLEPLQYPQGKAGLDGRLKDSALEALLKSLAQKPMEGLCILTTREPVTDLKTLHGKTVSEWILEHLSEEAGAELLYRAGVRRAGAAKIGADDKELREASREVGGHALTLQLLGSYLDLIEPGQGTGDVRKRALVGFQEADAKTQGGHAFRVIAAHEKRLSTGGEDGLRELAALRLLGLFDRPVDGGCLKALRGAPGIEGLTEPLVELTDDEWTITLNRLAELGFITVGDEDSSPSRLRPSFLAVDAHPLIREYFAKQLQNRHAEAWRLAHQRLYEHLCETTKPHQPDTLDGLQPLYQAVAHGCQAGLHEQARANVYRDRILRGTGSDGFYSIRKLGAIGADLGAVACFFERPWSGLSPNLSEVDQAWLLNEAASRLQALGRLTEAVEPMRVSMEMDVDRKAWRGAVVSAANLSELELTLGEVGAAVADGQRSVTFADRGTDQFRRMVSRAAHADALHQVGRREPSLRVFRQAEAMQVERQPEYPRLYSLQGFQYCDLLLSEAERVAWRVWCGVGIAHQEQSALVGDVVGNAHPTDLEGCANSCDEVAERAAQTLKWITEAALDLLSAALDHLTLGRAALYGELVRRQAAHSALEAAREHLTAAVDGLRASGTMDELPRGLLTRAWLRCVEGDESGSCADLDEALEMAERGSMRLFMGDVQLTRARLFCDRDSLDKAKELIKKCGYHRRDEELAEAERAAGGW